jgi:hypothetical protein
MEVIAQILPRPTRQGDRHLQRIVGAGAKSSQTPSPLAP